MLSACFRLTAAIHGYLAFYMPSNRAVDWLRTPRGLRWAIPVALVGTPSYLFAMSVCVAFIERGGRGYLNVLVMLFAWNAIKFAALCAVTPFRWLSLRLRDSGMADYQTRATLAQGTRTAASRRAAAIAPASRTAE